MTDDLFNNVNIETPSIDDSKDYYAELVGPEAKFKDNQALAKGKAYADALIEIQNRQMDAMRAENERLLQESRTRARLEEIADRIANSNTQQLASNEPPPVNEVHREPQLDPNKLDSLLDEKLTQREQQKKERENFMSVQSKLKERYGDNYQRNLQQHAESLGLTSDDINALARRSPKALFQTLGLDNVQTENFQAPPQSRHNSGFAPQGAKKRTWSYYQELKKSNPKLFYDTKTNIQMQKDLIELGDEFKDGDFRAFGD